jgi:hypothetical protein
MISKLLTLNKGYKMTDFAKGASTFFNKVALIAEIAIRSPGYGGIQKYITAKKSAAEVGQKKAAESVGPKEAARLLKRPMSYEPPK